MRSWLLEAAHSWATIKMISANSVPVVLNMNSNETHIFNIWLLSDSQSLVSWRTTNLFEGQSPSHVASRFIYTPLNHIYNLKDKRRKFAFFSLCCTSGLTSQILIPISYKTVLENYCLSCTMLLLSFYHISSFYVRHWSPIY